MIRPTADIYGYLHQTRSSRRLERETARNIELMWLLGNLVPSFDADTCKGSIVTRDWLAARLAKLDGKIAAVASEIAAADSEAAAYVEALNANDAAETQAASTDAASRQAALLAQREAVATDVAQLEVSGETQLSRTDPDSRLLTKTGQSVSGYNVQIAVDAAHKLIVAAEAVSDGNETGQLHAMAQAARVVMGVDRLRALTDVGYYNGEALRVCGGWDRGVRAQAGPRHALDWEGRFALDALAYDVCANVYRCPTGQLLVAMRGGRTDASGKLRIEYASCRSVCAGCGLRSQCLSAKGRRRVIERWEHEAVIERHRARMAGGDGVMRRRQELAEHPFGTLKCRAGYLHFLVRGLAKTRGELRLMVLCDNFPRVFNIIGLKKLISWLATSSLWLGIWLLIGLQAALRRVQARFHRWGDTMSAPADRLYGCHSTLNGRASVAA